MENKIIFEDYFQSFRTDFWKKSSHSFENNLAYFSGKNIFINDGRLCLKLSQERIKGKNYAGAELRSKNSYKYGIFSARLRGAKGEGIISSFFLYDTKGKFHEEIDIEFTGGNTFFIHFNSWKDQKSNANKIPLTFDASNSYHEYTISWFPDYICWQIDGKEVYRTSINIPQRKMKVMFNIWASKSNDWAGTFNPLSLPASMEIDYVKIFSNPE